MPIDVKLTVVTEYYFNSEVVRANVELVVRELFAFKNMDFAKPLYLSKIYEAVEALQGVYALTVTQFRRRDSKAAKLEKHFGKFGGPGLEELPELFKRAPLCGCGTGRQNRDR